MRCLLAVTICLSASLVHAVAAPPAALSSTAPPAGNAGVGSTAPAAGAVPATAATAAAAPTSPAVTKLDPKPGADAGVAFAAREVTQDVAGGTLHGTELVPADGARVPVVLLHAGSGPTDRNGNSIALPGANNALKLLAEALAARGIASVRYDKRLIAASTSPQWTEEGLRLDDYVADAVAWLKRLRADPRFTRVAMAGHSEGALIAALACKQAAVDGCVSIAGSGRNIDDLLNEQLRPHLSSTLYEQHTRIMSSLKQGTPVAQVPPELLMLYRPSVQPYLISSLKHEPRIAIAVLDMPVLIVQGTSDIQVGVSDARALSAAQPAAKLVLVDGMNHLLKMVGNDRALQVKSYGSSDLPVAPQLVTALADFVLALPAPSKAAAAAAASMK